MGNVRWKNVLWAKVEWANVRMVNHSNGQLYYGQKKVGKCTMGKCVWDFVSNPLVFAGASWVEFVLTFRERYFKVMEILRNIAIRGFCQAMKHFKDFFRGNVFVEIFYLAAFSK
jgi:hypothetical protein